MSQHTPGPWSFRRAVCTEGGKPSWRGNYAVCSSPETGLNLATVWGDMIPDDPRPAEANARLIAAAPEMLSMLRELEWAGCDEWAPLCLICGKYRTHGHHDDCEWVALIRKAEGGAP